MSNNVKYKNTHPVWTALGIIFLILILCAGVTALVGWLGFGWFTTDNEDEVVFEDPGTRDSGEIDGQGLVVTTYALTEDQYEEYGVNPLASSAYTLTVTFEGTVFDRSLTWELSWDESYDESDDVTDYVELSAYTGEEVVLSCLQPFSYNIYVTVYRTAYPDTFATCKLDYLASCEVSCNLSIDWYYDWWTCDDSSTFDDTFTYDVTYGSGTIQYEVSDFSCDYPNELYYSEESGESFAVSFVSNTSFLSYSALVDISEYGGFTLSSYMYPFDSAEILYFDCYGYSSSTNNVIFANGHFDSLNLSNGDPAYDISASSWFDSMEEFTYAMSQTGHLNDTYFTWMSYLYNGERQFLKLYIPISYDDTQASLSLNEGNVVFGA